jgi:S-methylmethionine-dependent homocysteine/selenocysteine methylase
MTLGTSLFLMDVVLGLAVIILLMAVAYRAGASHTDRKYIQRALQRQERANRIARNARQQYLETPLDMPTALLPQVGATSEAEWRAHG